MPTESPRLDRAARIGGEPERACRLRRIAPPEVKGEPGAARLFRDEGPVAVRLSPSQPVVDVSDGEPPAVPLRALAAAVKERHRVGSPGDGEEHRGSPGDQASSRRAVERRKHRFHHSMLSGRGRGDAAPLPAAGASSAGGRAPQRRTWWRWRDLNPRHSGYEPLALTN